ncbi:helix-turn-helix domain-containing protein [Nocardia sp. NPDC056000]|uniref:helix-turn-helix domain-containing protein n=1 Tax=Nocardia sp. NPDC056000 TaxID=3345674 RepID=UPI0035D7C58B
MESFELLAHPVRLRMVHAMRGGRVLTTAELCARLPDVSKATAYRHVELLANAGVLEVAGERRVRGAVERRYRLRPERAVIDQTAELTIEDQRGIFATAMAVLMAEFNTYLDRENADPATDLVGFRQHALWLDPTELLELIDELRRVIGPRLGYEPTPERGQYLLSPILFPIEERSEPDPE